MGADLLNWEDEKTHIFLNPRLCESERKELEQMSQDCGLKGHIWLSTSGTTGSGTTGSKLVALSKTALLSSAHAVNDYLSATTSATWLLCLPTFHVGGLSILARAHLVNASVRTFYPWKTNGLKEALEGVAFLSLVPTQVWDLVQEGIQPPGSLKAVFVGGDRLDGVLASRASALGWPIIPTFGMTECSSQIASGTPLKVLPHVQARVSNHRLSIKSDSLLTGYIKNGEFLDPKVDGWFETEDRVKLEGDHLKVLGRLGDVVKILGEIVDLPLLREKLSLIAERLKFSSHFHLVAALNERTGSELILKTDAPHQAAAMLRETFNAKVLPFQRIQRVEAATILRSELGKIIFVD